MLAYCVLFFALVTITWGQNEIITEWTVEQFPNPMTQPEKCGGIRGRPSYICDPNSILTSSFAELDHALNQTFMDTQCICSAYKCRDLNYRHGVHISVAVLANLKLTQGRTSALPEVEHFALNLESKHWNFGACDNDIVIVYSAGDNVIYTATGSAANYILDTQKIKDITSANGIYFRNKNPMAGLYAMIMDYRSVFQGGYQSYALYQESQNVRGLAHMVTASTSCLLVAIVTYLYNKL